MSNTKRFLAILDLLQKKTDEQHHMDAKEIACVLKEEYGFDIDPRSVRRAISEMVESGFPISCVGKYYYKGLFTSGEMNYLANAVRFGSGLTQEERNTLLTKLHSLDGKAESDTVPEEKPGNPCLTETLALIEKAMATGRQISFHYGTYDVDGQLKTSMRGANPAVYNAHPYGVVIVNGRYYLIATVNKHPNLSHYRIDRILDIKQRKGKIRPLAEELSLHKYIVEHPYMYPGEPQQFRIRVKRKHLNDVFDWFGTDITFENTTADTTEAIIRSEPRCMEFWLTRYAKIAQLIEKL